MTGTCTDTTRGLARLKSLGFTAIWVTPPVKNQVFQGASAGYHGYWGLDFTHVDPHLGTDADFAAFVNCAHGLGLKVYMDVVVNHTGDTISVSTNGFVPPSQVPYRTATAGSSTPRATSRRPSRASTPRTCRTPLHLPPLRHTKKPSG